MYDIYLPHGFLQRPELEKLKLEELYEIFPKNEIEEFITLERTGFLGLNLPLQKAKRNLRLLIDQNVYGHIYPIRYRDEEPKFTVEMAYPIAEKAIKEKQKKYPNITFSPIEYSSTYSGLGNLTFVSSGKEWIQSGLIPGALFVSIDKLDGHIWADDEWEELKIEYN